MTRAMSREEKRRARKVTTALQAFVAFLEHLLIAMETRHRYQKVWQGGEVWQRILTRSNLPEMHTDPNCWDPVNREPLLQIKFDRLHSFAAKGHLCHAGSD